MVVVPVLCAVNLPIKKGIRVQTLSMPQQQKKFVKVDSISNHYMILMIVSVLIAQK
jgi:hypothetical protein